MGCRTRVCPGLRAVALTFLLLHPCRWADPGYYEGDDDDGPDPLAVALPDKDAFQAIRALPAEAGSAILFTHRWAWGAGTVPTWVPGVRRLGCKLSMGRAHCLLVPQQLGPGMRTMGLRALTPH